MTEFKMPLKKMNYLQNIQIRVTPLLHGTNYFFKVILSTPPSLTRQFRFKKT